MFIEGRTVSARGAGYQRRDRTNPMSDVHSPRCQQPHLSAHQTRLLESAVTDKPNVQLHVEPTADHCCHNIAHVVRARMAACSPWSSSRPLEMGVAERAGVLLTEWREVGQGRPPYAWTRPDGTASYIVLLADTTVHMWNIVIVEYSRPPMIRSRWFVPPN